MSRPLTAETAAPPSRRPSRPRGTPAPAPSGAARIAAEIGTAILFGEPAEGALIPGELALCARFGASRTVVREALKLLAAKGLVEPRRRAGTCVRPRRFWQMLDAEVLGWRLAATGGEAKLVADLLQVRAVVEPAAAAIAARSRSPESLAAIEAAFAAMEQTAHDRTLFAGPDLAFHEAILAATENDVMVAFGALIETALGLFVRIASRHSGAPAPSLPLHGEILEAIRRRDPDGAERAMVRLLETTSRNVARNAAPPAARPETA